ncbi:MAG: hypothetical protein LBV50_08245 [Novosphingobium sp.]|jgi:hypothetical protein|nr:hypothetical protein [Novosphingobium sp.]
MSGSEPAFDRLAARLLARARVLAAARLRARRADAGRWREARLLWPLFGKG